MIGSLGYHQRYVFFTEGTWFWLLTFNLMVQSKSLNLLITGITSTKQHEENYQIHLMSCRHAPFALSILEWKWFSVTLMLRKTHNLLYPPWKTQWTWLHISIHSEPITSVQKAKADLEVEIDVSSSCKSHGGRDSHKEKSAWFLWQESVQTTIYIYCKCQIIQITWDERASLEVSVHTHIKMYMIYVRINILIYIYNKIFIIYYVIVGVQMRQKPSYPFFCVNVKPWPSVSSQGFTGISGTMKPCDTRKKWAHTSYKWELWGPNTWPKAYG